MTDSMEDEEELFKGGWVAIVRYPAMLGGTVAGQLFGIAIDVAVGTRGLWIPLACSVVLEALIGARFGASRGLPELDGAECVRVSVRFSVVILSVSAPLLVWVGASHAQAVPGGVGLSFLTLPHLAAAVAALAVATAVRAALLMAFAPRVR